MERKIDYDKVRATILKKSKPDIKPDVVDNIINKLKDRVANGFKPDEYIEYMQVHSNLSYDDIMEQVEGYYDALEKHGVYYPLIPMQIYND